MTITITKPNRESGTYAEIQDKNLQFSSRKIVEDVLWLYGAFPEKNANLDEFEVYKAIEENRTGLEKIAAGKKGGLSIKKLMYILDLVHFMQSHTHIPLDEYENINIHYAILQQAFPEKNRTVASRAKERIYLQTVSGQLSLDQNSGDISLKKVKSQLSPSSREFAVLLKLMTSVDNVATYSELLGENPSKQSKRALAFTIRDAKEMLGILPAKGRKNKDIFQNIKRHGYRLAVKKKRID